MLPIVGAVMGAVGAVTSGLGAIVAGDAQRDAARAAQRAQTAAHEANLELQQPYVDAGLSALGDMGTYTQTGMQANQAQADLAGLNGMAAQQKAFSLLGGDSLINSGEQALLQNASATGGLRGGNTQAALAQLRPQLMQQIMANQQATLGGLAAQGLGATSQIFGAGQAMAAGQAAGNYQNAAAIGQGHYARGAANAGVALGIGNALQQGMNSFGGLMAQGGGAAAAVPGAAAPAAAAAPVAGV